MFVVVVMMCVAVLGTWGVGISTCTVEGLDGSIVLMENVLLELHMV